MGVQKEPLVGIDCTSHQWEQSAADAKALHGKYEDCLASDEDEFFRGDRKGVARSYERSALNINEYLKNSERLV